MVFESLNQFVAISGNLFVYKTWIFHNTSEINNSQNSGELIPKKTKTVLSVVNIMISMFGITGNNPGGLSWKGVKQ